jgi:hypothetical protein
MKKNDFIDSKFGTMKYIMKNGVCYFSLGRRGLSETLRKVSAYNDRKLSKPIAENGYLFIDYKIMNDEDILRFFLQTYFSSEEFIRDKYFSHKFNSQSVSDLEILADILVCIDHNKGDTTSSISYDEDGIRTSLNIFEKKSFFANMFSSSEKGTFVTSLPLTNVVAFVAENTSVTFKLNDGRLLMYGIRSTVSDSNFEVIYKANLVDFYG